MTPGAWPVWAPGASEKEDFFNFSHYMSIGDNDS